jgi:hypothetical protein
MNSLFQLEIPKRSAQCFHKGERLLPGMEIYSLLIEDETKKLIRRDFCSACWTQAHVEGSLESRGYWKSKIERRKPTSDCSRVDRALALLKELLQAAEPQEAEIFVLCLFLSHARQLALRQEFEKEGATYQLYEVLRQEEYVTIKAINLSNLQIEEIQKSLACKLQS